MARRTVAFEAVDNALQTFLSYEATARESIAELEQAGIIPPAGPGADLLRAQVASECWHSAVRTLALAMGGREWGA